MAEMGAQWEFQDRVATAFDEVGVLTEMGREGWEMTRFGPFVLHFRRPLDPDQRVAWEYRRETEFNFGTPAGLARLQQEGWSYCGSWMMTFHYYKRAGRSGA